METTYELENFGTNIVGYSPFTLTIDPANFNVLFGQKIAKMKYIFGNGEEQTIIDNGIINPIAVPVSTTYYLESSESFRYELKIEYYYFNNLIKNTGIIYVEVRPPKVLKIDSLDDIGNFEDIHLLKIKSWKDKNLLVFETVNPNNIFIQNV